MLLTFDFFLCGFRTARPHSLLQATFVPRLRARTEEAKQEDLKIAPTTVRVITMFLFFKNNFHHFYTNALELCAGSALKGTSTLPRLRSRPSVHENYRTGPPTVGCFACSR